MSATLDRNGYAWRLRVLEIGGEILEAQPLGSSEGWTYVATSIDERGRDECCDHRLDAIIRALRAKVGS